MVPIEYNTSNILLRDVHRVLMEQIKSVDLDSVEGAFVAWMNSDTSIPALSGLPAHFTVTNYHHVARLGFLMEIGHIDNEKYFELLKDGLNRVAGRTITLWETEPAPFRHDAVALLGLALGAKRVGGEVQIKVLQWMQSFVTPSDKATVPWKRVFYLATLGLVGDTVDQREIQDLSECSDIELAFAARGINAFHDIDLNLAYQTSCYNTMTQDSEPAISACRLNALRYLSKGIPTVSMDKPTVPQILDLLDRLVTGLKRWPWEDKPKTTTSTAQRWDIQNEYHVQSLVYSILAPIFPDIEDEFYFEPVGQLNPRADIGLPALSLIVEIKFLRPGIPFKNIIEEIAADTSLYFKKGSVFAKKYSQMIVLLWDNSCRNQHHHDFKKGICQLPNISGAVVISRPGNMTAQTIPSGEVKDKRNQTRKKRKKHM